MADISITNTAVVANLGGGDIDHFGVAGETIAAGNAVYQSSSTNKYGLADSDGASSNIKAAVGIALNDAALNQPVKVLKAGDLTINAVLTAGATYFLSNTPGGICPDADVGAGEAVVQLGIAKSTTVLGVRVINPGVSR